jgi:hypothetical protein
MHLVHCDNQFVAAFFSSEDADRCVDRLSEGMEKTDHGWKYTGYTSSATKWKAFVSGGTIVVITVIYVDHNATTNVWHDETGATIIRILTNRQNQEACKKCGAVGDLGAKGLCWVCEDTEV